MTQINQDVSSWPAQQVEPHVLLWLEGVGRHLLAAHVEVAAHGTKAIRMDRWRVTPVEIRPEDEQRAIISAAVTGKIDLRGGVPSDSRMEKGRAG